jgi:hypothetical protein
MSRREFLKGEIHYNVKPEDRKGVRELRVLVVRIHKDYEFSYRIRMEIDDKQEFKYDKSQQKESEFLWKRCPEYTGIEDDIYSTHPKIMYYFYNEGDYNEFIDKVGIKPKGKTLWYLKRPEPEILTGYYTTHKPVKSQYPIYIVSYKRYDTLLTVMTLEEMGLNYYIVIRPTEDEPDNYRKGMKEKGIKNIDEKLMIMSDDWIKEQELMGNGYSIIHRNYAWYDAEQKGFTHHWCLDDNMEGIFYRNRGSCLRIKSGVAFYFIEEYIKQYPNVYQAGMNYNHLVPSGGHRNVIIKNSRIYSCVLNRHFDDIRWRGKYNEDTDLSLRILKLGKATMNFQIFLCGKKATGSCRGGNMETAYQGRGFDDKVDELVSRHPDVAKKVIKYGRPHHYVSYNVFEKNDLTPIEYNLKIPIIKLVKD